MYERDIPKSLRRETRSWKRVSVQIGNETKLVPIYPVDAQKVRKLLLRAQKKDGPTVFFMGQEHTLNPDLAAQLATRSHGLLIDITKLMVPKLGHLHHAAIGGITRHGLATPDSPVRVVMQTSHGGLKNIDSITSAAINPLQESQNLVDAVFDTLENHRVTRAELYLYAPRIFGFLSEHALLRFEPGRALEHSKTATE